MPRVKQAEFDWTWAQRKEWIEEAELPWGRAGDGSRVSPTIMAGVLNAINDHLGNNAEAWPSQDKIAKRVKCSAKSIKRACDALAALSLLIVIPRPCAKGTQNHYRIVWSELQLLQPDRRRAWDHVLRESARPPLESSPRTSDTFEGHPDNGRLEPSLDTFSDPRSGPKSERAARPSEPPDTTGRHRTSAGGIGHSVHMHRTRCPGASDTMSDEHLKEDSKKDHHLSSDTGVSTATRSQRALSVEEVVVMFVRLGVRTAATLVGDALDAGCDTRSLAAIARWFERSQRANRHKWRKADAVLYVRLKNALPGVRAWEGWPDGLARPKAKPKPKEDFVLVRTARRREYASDDSSITEMFRKAKKEAAKLD